MSLSERLLPAARPRFDGHWVSVENSLHILEGDSLLFLLDTSHRALCIHIIPVANIYMCHSGRVCWLASPSAMELYFMVGCSITS